jgi:small subunit ribosomal protein S17
MKVFSGKVVSTKMIRTATVEVERTVVNRLYKKRIKRVRKFHVHDEFGKKVGDAVKFVASKPYSKSVKWNIVENVKAEKPKVGKSEAQNPKSEMVRQAHHPDRSRGTNLNVQNSKPVSKKVKKGDK